MRKFYTFLLFVVFCISSKAYTLDELRSRVNQKESILYSQTSSQQKYFEGFEDWDGHAVDWLPSGWSEIISNESFINSKDGVFTWHVGGQKNYEPYPVEGKYSAKIYYAYELLDDGKTVDLPQDEWLITPAYDVVDGDILKFTVGYSPMFLFNMNNENVDWNKMDFKEGKRMPSTTLKVYIREYDNVNEVEGEWVEVLDLYKQWEDTSFNDLFNLYMDTDFYSYEIDLSDYANKSVQVTFRYVGMYGNTMQLDEISISNELVDGISNIRQNLENLNVYRIDGVAVLKNVSLDELKYLPKGLYIVNGRKVFIR